jgi:ribonuclease P protein component
MNLWQSLGKKDFKNFKKKVKNNFFSIAYAEDFSFASKAIGFKLSKKHIKKAVTRNICKRKIREYCRLKNFPCNKIVLSSIRKLTINNKELKKNLEQLLNQLPQNHSN